MNRILVTGGTGLIGRALVQRLLGRASQLLLLVRKESASARAEYLDGLRGSSGAAVDVLHGDVTADGLGLSDEQLEKLDVERLDAVFHVAGYYDLTGDVERMRLVNVAGTENVVSLLESNGFSGVLHHLSSIAVTGDYHGSFGEDELEKKQRFPTEYHRTKYESERRVRKSSLRFRIYRPSAVVGHSKTGEMDRVDGPYFLFRAIHEIRRKLPPWVTLPGLDSARVNMVPVDFVADAIDAIAAADGLDGKGFFIVDPDPPKFVETFNLIADAAEAPRMSRFKLGRLGKMIPGASNVVSQMGGLKFMGREIGADLGIPAAARDSVNPDVEYDTTNLVAALEAAGLRCPKQAEYVEPLWDYYLRNLDPRRDKAGRYRRLFAGKRALITGGSSGVGEALGIHLARAGAHVVLVARRKEELERVVARVREEGGRADYVVADLTDFEACDAAVESVHDEHGPIDMLINNAGRSIRRPLAESLERFHDLERVMQLNFFAPARLIRAVLPTMRERGGWVVNVLSAGTHFPSPRFGAYTASKAALSQLSDVLAAEHLHENVRVSNAYLYWVRTPMMDATGKYENTKAMSPDDAAEMILDGVADRRQHVSRGTDLRRFVINHLHPSGIARILNVLYRISSDDPNAHPEVSLDRVILQKFVRGPLM